MLASPIKKTVSYKLIRELSAIILSHACTLQNIEIELQRLTYINLPFLTHFDAPVNECMSYCSYLLTVRFPEL